VPNIEDNLVIGNVKVNDDAMLVMDNNGDIVPINKFNVGKCVKNPFIIVIGKRGVGKTNFVVDVVKRLGLDNGRTLVISPADKVAANYTRMLSAVKVAYKYDPQLLHAHCSDNGRSHNGQKVEPGCIVLDDCLLSKGSWVTDEPFRDLIFNHRNLEQTVIITMQFPLGIPPELRCAADYVVMFNDDFATNQKRLYDHYAGMFPTFDCFRSIYSKLATNYRCMVIRQCCTPNVNFREKVFWYQSDVQEVVNDGGKESDRIVTDSSTVHKEVIDSDNDSDSNYSNNSSVIDIDNGENVLIYLKNGVIQRTINFDAAQVSSVNELFDELIPRIVVPDSVENGGICSSGDASVTTGTTTVVTGTTTVATGAATVSVSTGTTTVTTGETAIVTETRTAGNCVIC